MLLFLLLYKVCSQVWSWLREKDGSVMHNPEASYREQQEDIPDSCPTIPRCPGMKGTKHQGRVASSL